MRDLTRDEGQLAFMHFDSWVARSASRQEITGRDIGAAERFLRRLDVNLRTPDAIHIAVAQRVAATLVTLDRGMAIAARALGMAVATP
jgi:predicted nucleic acid-binding protein